MSFIQFVVLFRTKNMPHSLALEMDDKPSFQSNEYGITSVNVYENYTDKEVTISTSESSKVRKNNYYFSSVIIKDDVNFKQNRALGAYLESGSGGAVFTCFCKLQATKATFEENHASLGGAICGQASSYFLSGCQFKKNDAFKLGGAIYLHNGFREGQFGTVDIQQNFIITGCKFIQNTAQECGGSICLIQVITPYADTSEFTDNKASLSGGAIYAIEISDLKLFKCNFSGNLLENKRKLTSNNNKNYREKSGFAFNQRGGGAIYASGSKASFYTQNCRFENNKFSSESTSTIDYFGGHSIMIQGMNWRSYTDCLQSPFETNHVGNFTYERSQGENKCDSGNETLYPFPKYYSFASPSNNINKSSSVASLPSPTTFTLYATPNIKNPQVNTPKVQLNKITFKMNTASTIPLPPTRSNHPPVRTNVPKNFTLTTRITTIMQSTFTTTFTPTNTTTTTITSSNNGYYYTFATTQILIPVQIETTTEINVAIFDDAAHMKYVENQKKQKIKIAVAVLAACIGLVIVVIVIIIFLKKKQADASDQSVASMESEQVGNYMNTTTTTAVTQENPLWSSQLVNYDGDDPFKGDFQEQGKEGYFAAANEEMRDVDQL